MSLYDTNEATVVEVPSVKEGLNKVVGLPDFLVQLAYFQMCIPKLTL